MVLGESVGLIYGTPAEKVGPYYGRFCKSSNTFSRTAIIQIAKGGSFVADGKEPTVQLFLYLWDSSL